MKWEKLPNGKWKYVKPLRVKGKINVDNPDYSKRLHSKMKKINRYCDSCGHTYNLAEPCEHHLSDSPEHQAKYKSIQIKKKKKQESVEATKQERFI